MPARTRDPFGDVRDSLEQRIAQVMGRALTQQERAILELIAPPFPGAAVNLSKLNGQVWELQGRAVTAMAEVLMEGYHTGARVAELNGLPVEVDYNLVNDQARTWAYDHAGETIDGVQATTRQVVGEALSHFVGQLDVTRQDLEDLLAPHFGAARAEMIAVTEATRSLVQGVHASAQQAVDAGFQLSEIWHTSQDDLVCEICGPVNDKAEETPGSRHWVTNEGPDLWDAPPAHPRCRCWTTYDWPEPKDVPVEDAQAGQDVPTEAPPAAPSISDPVPDKFKDYKEANAWLEARYPDVTFDLKGVDTKYMPGLVRQFQTLSQDYPDAAARLWYLGTYREKTSVPSGPNRGGGGIQVGRWSGEWAHVSLHGHVLAVNPNYWGKPQRLDESLARSAVPSVDKDGTKYPGWHPPGSTSADSIISHEFGHVVDSWLSVDPAQVDRARQVSEWRQTTRMTRGLDGSRGVSQYAMRNGAELFAEAFESLYHAPVAERSTAARKLETILGPVTQKAVTP